MTLSPQLRNELKKALNRVPLGDRAPEVLTVTDEIIELLRNRTWGGVPEPSIENLLPSVAALKEGYETLMRTRGNVEDSAVLVQDLITVVELLIPYIIDEVGKKYHP